MENYDRNPFSVKIKKSGKSFGRGKKIGEKFWSGIKKSGKSFGRVIKYRGKNSSGENFVNPSKFSSLSPDIFFPDKVFNRTSNTIIDAMCTFCKSFENVSWIHVNPNLKISPSVGFSLISFEITNEINWNFLTFIFILFDASLEKIQSCSK